MTLLEALSAVRDSPVGHIINASNHLVGATTQIVHVLGFVLLLASVVLINLRLVGWVFRRQRIADVDVDLNRLILVGLVTAAGVLGNTLGYWFGRKIGPTMFRWKDNFFFKKRYLDEAHTFYEKHGGGAIVFARFLPIVRTFAPIIAGIVDMDRKKFMFYNIAGCAAWVCSMIFAGHFLQKWVKTQFNFDLRDHLEVIVIGIVLVTTAPVIGKLVTGRSSKK
ncbi:MAG: VTT domain-containing protein [Flavihumibacter sp.]